MPYEHLFQNTTETPLAQMIVYEIIFGENLLLKGEPTSSNEQNEALSIVGIAKKQKYKYMPTLLRGLQEYLDLISKYQNGNMEKKKKGHTIS